MSSSWKVEHLFINRVVLGGFFKSCCKTEFRKLFFSVSCLDRHTDSLCVCVCVVVTYMNVCISFSACHTITTECTLSGPLQCKIKIKMTCNYFQFALRILTVLRVVRGHSLNVFMQRSFSMYKSYYKSDAFHSDSFVRLGWIRAY